MFVIAILICLVVTYGIWETRTHLRKLRGIALRIHVNGSRGKSSVTRLIAASLRAGGTRTCAKTTGSAPRLIAEDGSERAIDRWGRPSITEQVRAIDFAARRGAQAVVVECMALEPSLQELGERMMIQSSIGIITNVRADHLDEMGPTPADVAAAMARSIPRKGTLLTAETHPALLKILRTAAERLGSKMVHVTPDGEGVDEAVLSSFAHIEHPENVALALRLAEMVGLDRRTALRGMAAAQPDPGALQIVRGSVASKEVQFVNAFAANDPDSTLMTYERVRRRLEPEQPSVIILCCRADRPRRSRQLGSLLGRMESVGSVLLAGAGTRLALRAALRTGFSPDNLSDMEAARPEAIVDRAVTLLTGKGMIFGMGNLGGAGGPIVDVFRRRLAGHLGV